MLLTIHVWSLLFQATSQQVSLQWHHRVSESKVCTCNFQLLSSLYYFIKIVPTPSTISLRSNVTDGAQIIGSDVELTCTVELNSASILGSEISLLMVSAQLSNNDGTPLVLTGPIVTGTTFTYTTQLNSFERNEFGNYTCIATVGPQPLENSTYITGTTVLSDSLLIKPGKFML